MQIALSELATRVGGTIEGNSDALISCLCPLDEPQKTGLTFTRKRSEKILEVTLKLLDVAALCVPLDFELTHKPSFPLLKVKDPLTAIVSLIPLFTPPKTIARTIHPSAIIDPSSSIGENVAIGPYSVIGARCIVGDNVIIHPHVTIYDDVTIGSECEIHSGVIIRENCVLGARCLIQNGAIIGSDGFGYISGATGHKHIPHVGSVILQDDVDIGANSCIDRGALGSTSLGQGTKLDNLVQIGHNVKTGNHCLLCAEVGIGGSVHIGNFVILGGKAGIADHISVTDNVRVAAATPVIHDIEKSGDYAGLFPAVPVMQYRRQVIAIEKLPSLLKKLQKLDE